MNYYEVLVGTMTYHGETALTYGCAEALATGQLVRVPLRARSALGIVVQKVHKPSFAVKPITSIAPCPPLPKQSLQLLTWLHAYYPAPLGAVVRLFVPPTEVFPGKIKDERSKIKGSPAAPSLIINHKSLINSAPPLTTDQQSALAAIAGPGTFLLHGVTGSGKSRVYMELTARAFAAGQSALVLTPEIGLTAQLTKTFREAYRDQVFVLHSQLTAAQRRDIWYELLVRTTPAIVIGPRSALFSPLRNLGLVVLDESHDTAYKNESAPHYHTGRVAAKLAALHGATLVLGSATPSVEDYYLAGLRQRPVVAMENLAKSADSPLSIHMVDLRRPELFSRNPLFSDVLVREIGGALQRGEQSLVYLNRRGTANVVLCQVCGWQALCPNCDLGLTYHGDTHELRCHVCGHTKPLPMSCAVCGNTEILFKSIGTKAVVTALQKLFPAARIQRFDTDARKAERLEQHVGALAEGSADIIVGTQMIGKGLDLPKLSVVGVVNADSSLLIPDYTAAEQTYQLISQVVGRVGRGHRAGTVVVQTYDPQNATLLSAVHRQWQQFYKAELAERHSYRFPPFVYMLKLRVLRATTKAAEAAATALASSLQATFPGATVDGPAPSFHPRQRGKYSWQLLVKSAHRKTLVDIISSLPSGWQYDIDPINLL
ncbi:MAG TPA: primosomal protein N' [Candidatus Saccharimonadales bacterium]|nr:primosomal protein N' [Candidatus Saccharimonadales bacterium]